MKIRYKVIGMIFTVELFFKFVIGTPDQLSVTVPTIHLPWPLYLFFAPLRLVAEYLLCFPLPCLDFFGFDSTVGVPLLNLVAIIWYSFNFNDDFLSLTTIFLLPQSFKILQDFILHSHQFIITVLIMSTRPQLVIRLVNWLNKEIQSTIPSDIFCFLCVDSVLIFH